MPKNGLQLALLVQALHGSPEHAFASIDCGFIGNSGFDVPSSFSNQLGSLKSSIGLFVTEETYDGKHGYSLKLRGLDRGWNDNAESRAIVIHGADYVNLNFAKKYQRLGRSWGCPALASNVASKVIDVIKGGTAVFAYYPDKKLLEESPYLR